MRYDPTCMTLLDPLQFRMAWWGIHKFELKLSRSELDDPDLVALTIVGASPGEQRLIREWCQENGGIKVYRVRSWEDEAGGTDGLWFTYLNQEFAVLATAAAAQLLCEWLDALPKRNAAMLVRGHSRAELARQLRGKVYRIISLADSDDGFVVSVADDDLAFELSLRGD